MRNINRNGPMGLALGMAVLGAAMLGGCAQNYAGEGALGGAGVGAVVAGMAGGNVGTGAAVGAALGAAAGSQVRKHDGACWRTDAYGNEYRVRC